MRSQSGGLSSKLWHVSITDWRADEVERAPGLPSPSLFRLPLLAAIGESALDVTPTAPPIDCEFAVQATERHTAWMRDIGKFRLTEWLVKVAVSGASGVQ